MLVANPPPHGCGGGAYKEVFTACLRQARPLHFSSALQLSTSRARTPRLQGRNLKVRDI